MKKRVLIAAVVAMVVETFAATVAWNGGDAINPTFWDRDITANWSGSLFHDGDIVVFSDAGAGAVSIRENVAPASVTFANTTSNNYTLSENGGGETLTVGGVLSVTGAGAVTIHGIIAGSGALNKTGASTGTLALNGANTYAGGTILRGGITIASDSAAFGAGSVQLQDESTPSPVLRLDASGGDLDFANTFAFNNEGSYKTIQLTAGNATISGAISLLDAGGTDNRFSVEQGSVLTLSGVIGGNALNIDNPAVGGGMVVLSGDNTYSGGTLLEEGVLRLEHDHALGSGSITVKESGIAPWIELADGIHIANPALFDSVGDPKGIRLESGTERTAAYSGAISVLETGANNFELDANSTGGDNDQTQILTISGAITSTAGAGVELVGDGVVNLTGVNTITDYIKLTRLGAILRIGDGSGNGDYALGSATVHMAQSSRFQLTDGVDTKGGNLLVVDNGAAKTLEIKDLNTGTAESATFNGNIALEDTDVGDFDVSASDIDTLTLAGNISGLSGVDATGTGIKIFSGNGTYAGATSIEAGTLAINGDHSLAIGAVTVKNGATLAGSGTLGGAVTVQSGARIAPGNSVGMLVVNAAVTLEADSTYEVEIDGTTCDKLEITGGNTLALGAEVATLNLGTLTGDLYVIATAEEITGRFSDHTADSFSIGNGYWIHYVRVVDGEDHIQINKSPTPTSSGVDVRAYQAADGIYVEFVAYDVEADGTIQLALMGANGEVVWSGSVDVTAGPRFFARFLVPGLELGGTYNFQVRDEVGKWWEANGVTVEAFATEMVSATLAGITLSFDSLPEREYEIQWTGELGGTWQTVETVTANGEQTRVVVAYPNADDPSGFFRVQAR